MSGSEKEEAVNLTTNHDEFQYLNLIDNIIKNGKRIMWIYSKSQ